MARRGETQFHHRNEAMAAGDDASVGIELTEEGDRELRLLEARSAVAYFRAWHTTSLL